MNYREWEENETRLERAEDERERIDRHLPVIFQTKRKKTMDPILKEGKLSVRLHKPEVRQLEKAYGLGKLLLELHQPEGEALVGAVAAVLQKFGGADVED